jgi:hypothetical protein
MNVVHRRRKAKDDTLLDAHAQMVPMVAQDLCCQCAIYRVIKNAIGDVGQNMLVTRAQNSDLGLHEFMPSMRSCVDGALASCVDGALASSAELAW